MMHQGSAPGIGHNGGPDENGLSWRKQCWTKARARLLPTLPIEVVRMRVRRAAELGLDYKTYAGIRASTGHDLVAFLFSSNALRVVGRLRDLPADRAMRLQQVTGATRIGLAQAPLTPTHLTLAAPMLDTVHVAPSHLASFAQTRDHIRGIIGKLPSDTVLLIGDHRLEADWCAAGRLAGYLSAERFFGA